MSKAALQLFSPISSDLPSIRCQSRTALPSSSQKELWNTRPSWGSEVLHEQQQKQKTRLGKANKLAGVLNYESLSNLTETSSSKGNEICNFPVLLIRGYFYHWALYYEYSMKHTQGNAGLPIWEMAVREPAPNNNTENVSLSSGCFFLLNGLQVIIYFLWKMSIPWEVPLEAVCANLLDWLDSLVVRHAPSHHAQGIH